MSTPEDIISRLRAMNAAVAPESPKIKETLTRVGILLEAEIKMNVRRQGLIDSSRLINSIRYEFDRGPSDATVLRVGSFSVPYAAIHEFGGPFTDRMRRAMFAAIRERGGPERPSKGRIVGNRVKASPYLRPAIQKHRGRVVDLLREAALSGRS